MQNKEAVTAGGWCWSDGRPGGTETSLLCSWVEEGWLPSKRELRKCSFLMALGLALNNLQKPLKNLYL